MPEQLRAVAFDLDEDALANLGEALPGWQVEVVRGATAAIPNHDWSPGTTNLLVVMARPRAAETLELCRLLVSCSIFATGRKEENLEKAREEQPEALEKRAPGADAPLLVLLRPGQESIVQAALEAGADGCLALPVHAKEMADMLVQARRGNRPGRHTLNTDRAQCDDRWRDDGGQG